MATITDLARELARLDPEGVEDGQYVPRETGPDSNPGIGWSGPRGRGHLVLTLPESQIDLAVEALRRLEPGDSPDEALETAGIHARWWL